VGPGLIRLRPRPTDRASARRDSSAAGAAASAGGGLRLPGPPPAQVGYAAPVAQRPHPRRRTVVGAVALVAALGAGAWLLGQPTPDPRSAGSGAAPPTAAAPAVTEVYPGAKLSAGLPGALPDGTVFVPELYLSTEVAAGIAMTADGAHTRMLLRGPDGATTELRRLSTAADGRFEGFAAHGDVLVWAEVTATGGDVPHTEIWRANWRTGGQARRLTADTGRAIFRKTQFDLVVADSAVHWIAAESSKAARAQVRSVPLAGGRVTRRAVPGGLGLSTWPWLSSALSGVSLPAELYDLRTGRRVKAVTSPSEEARCTPAWCRVAVSGAQGVVRVDIMRPDGRDRARVAGPGAVAVLNDVALLDRFEPFGAAVNPEDGSSLLQLYDIRSGRTVVVAEGVAAVDAAGGMLWWSRGAVGSPYTWYALDLRSLA